MRRRPLLPLAIAAAVAPALLAAPSTAQAYERQWHAGGSFGYVARLGGETYHGMSGGLHLAYGITDAFNGIAHVDVSGFPGGKLLIASGAIGAAYVFDVLQWVPYVGAAAGGADVVTLTSACGPCHAFRINLEIPFGLDYQVSRSFAIGGAGRVQLLLLGANPRTVIGAFARAEYIWGF